MNGLSKQGQAVPVDMTPRVMNVGKDGSCELTVRRLRRSEQNRIAAAAKLGDDHGSRAKHAELLVRRAIADAKNQGRSIIDVETHQPVPLRFVELDGVGMVATSDFYDAMSEDDAVRVAHAAQGIDERLTEDQAGNSEVPPAGSIPSASGNAVS